MHIGEERLCVSKECLPNEMTQANTRALTSCVVPRLLAYCVPHELDFQKHALKVSSVHGSSVHTVKLSQLPHFAKELKLIHLKISYKILHHFHPSEPPSLKRTVQCLTHLCSRLLWAENEEQPQISDAD